jgi:hypothetical protein
MHSLAEFLYAAPARRSTPAILAWWERRRLAYNAFVGAAGLVSLGSVGVAGVLLGEAANLGGLLAGAAVFGVMANLCYFLGPATEVVLEKLWGRRVLPAGPALYRMGLTFSVGLALLPTLLAVMLMTARVVLGVLGLHWD